MSDPRCPKCGEPVSKGGGSRGAQRWKHRGRNPACKWHGTQPVGLAETQAEGVNQTVSKALARDLRKTLTRRLVITGAQNATPVNKAFLQSLLTYCDHRQAQLIVIPYRYKNPTSMWSEKAEHDDWWAPELAPYLMDQRVQLNEHLIILGDIKTQPTATAPLQGFETVTGAASAIVAHPKVSLKCVPTPQSRMAKILMTTGVVTEKNYIESKAGKKAEHHHTFGAAVVELDGKRFHLRRINAMRDGSFCDLDAEYRGDEVKTGIQIEALVMGDTHQEFVDQNVVKATFKGKGSICSVLRPKRLVWHDIHDFHSRNHHHRGEVFVNFAKFHAGADDVRAGLEKTFAFVDEHSPEDAEDIFVPSNHPDALARWVKEADPKADPRNAVFWAETFVAMCQGAQMTESGARTIDPFVYWAKRMLKKKLATAHFPSRNESFLIKDIDVANHYDAGPNGSRGTLKGFTKIGVKTIGGHAHEPGEDEGAMRVGTNSRKDLEYVRGPSSWMHADAVIYRNGKRSLLFIIDGRWRLDN